MIKLTNDAIFSKQVIYATGSDWPFIDSIFCNTKLQTSGPVAQSWISVKPGLTLKKTYTVNPGLELIYL